MFISYTQKETNQIIYDEIKKASKYIHITTMFFNDEGMSLNFIKLLNDKVKEYPDIEININIGLNPFLKSNLKNNLNKKIKLNFIPMKLINTYHIRFFSTESIAAVGGIDITKFNLSKKYIQFTLFIPIKNNIVISKTISNKNLLYDFTEDKNVYITSNIDPYTKIKQLIDTSKYHIFIDNQYFFSKKFTNIIVEKKENNPKIKIQTLLNDNFKNNIFKDDNILMKLFNFFKTNTMNALNRSNINLLENKNIIVNAVEKKYTHNKIFIFDKKYILMGSMNIMNKSLQHSGGDIELCFLIKNKKIANEILNYYNNNVFNI